MTIKEIAQICGVSRGTVDRVLNRRGRVKPETEQLILSTIESEGYTKSIVGRALSVKKTAPVIGTILCSEGNAFFDDVICGFTKAAEELSAYDAVLLQRTMRGHDVQRQLALLDEMDGRVSALVIEPINDPAIEKRLIEFIQKGIPTVTVNTDIAVECRCCYVGSDYESGGKTAAALLELLTKGKGQVGVVEGVPTLMGHVLRQRGFEKRLRQCVSLPIVARESAMDNGCLAYEVTQKMLREHSEIDAIFVVAAGAAHVCQAVIDAGRKKDICMVAYDDIPATREMMRRGLIKAVVCQQPVEQGYRSVKAAFDMILSGQMLEDQRVIMENQIKIIENME
ncbi:MAG: LacI family DNA-binding transcriptional regulator [Eubacteriales bacterium]|nr:LacI family DNA-binding transcriptional regulator [Eubacteriales bacterium]